MATVRTVIAGKTWTLRFVRSITYGGFKCYGLCVHESRELQIESSLSGLLLIDTVVHESLHAHDWKVHEETIELAARHIALELLIGGKLPSVRKARQLIRDTLAMRVFGLNEDFAKAASADIQRVLYHPEVRGRI